MLSLSSTIPFNASPISGFCSVTSFRFPSQTSVSYFLLHIFSLLIYLLALSFPAFPLLTVIPSPFTLCFLSYSTFHYTSLPNPSSFYSLPHCFLFLFLLGCFLFYSPVISTYFFRLSNSYMFFDFYLFQFIFSFLPFNICSLFPFHTLLFRLLHISFASRVLCFYVLILPISPISLHLFLSSSYLVCYFISSFHYASFLCRYRLKFPFTHFLVSTFFFIFLTYYSLWIQFQSVNIYSTNTPALLSLSSRK